MVQATQIIDSIDQLTDMQLRALMAGNVEYQVLPIQDTPDTLSSVQDDVYMLGFIIPRNKARDLYKSGELTDFQRDVYDNNLDVTPTQTQIEYSTKAPTRYDELSADEIINRSLLNFSSL
jgi:hypothetical protein